MGAFDKLKKILFDEEEVEEVSEQLPENTPKKELRRESGIINYGKETIEEEDPIKELHLQDDIEEIKLVKEELMTRSTRYVEEEDEFRPRPREVEHKREESRYDLPASRDVREKPISNNYERERISRNDYLREEPKKEDTFVQTDKYGLRRDYKAELTKKPVNKPISETKDYKSVVKDIKNPGKKPFEVTPVISPVYGILDKNYTADSVIEKNKTTDSLDKQKKRLYGTEQKPSVVERRVPEVISEPVVEIKEEIKEEPKVEDDYLDSIRNIISEDFSTKKIETVPETTIEDAFDDTEEIKRPVINYEEDYEDDAVIENSFDDIDEIDSAYTAYEDEEEPVITGSFDEEDEIPDVPLDDYDAPTVDIETLINNPMDEEEETIEKEALDDTIETDLFNLIDSMYKSDDREED